MALKQYLTYLENMMIRFLLLYRIEDTDRHPGLMLAGLGALIVLRGALEQLL